MIPVAPRTTETPRIRTGACNAKTSDEPANAALLRKTGTLGITHPEPRASRVLPAIGTGHPAMAFITQAKLPLLRRPSLETTIQPEL